MRQIRGHSIAFERHRFYRSRAFEDDEMYIHKEDRLERIPNAKRKGQ